MKLKYFSCLVFALLAFGFAAQVRADEPDPIVPVVHETFIIRNGANVIWQGSVVLPAEGTVSINGHDVNARSVLGVLYALDQTNDEFTLSNLQYFDAFSSFYLKCLQVGSATELCDNWQYAVGSFTPFTSIDQTILTGSETIGIYFGSSRIVRLSATDVLTSTPISATALSYDYQTDSWNPISGVSIGVTLPNPNDPWNPTVVSLHPVDATGTAIFTISNPNTYTLGIAEDFYFPSYTVVVQAPPSTPGNNNGQAADNSAAAAQPAANFSVPLALNFLKSQQSSDGSFGSDLYTDWAAIAYGAADFNDASRDALLGYLNTEAKLFSSVTDNERRAMALLALGQNPYSFNKINYIETIVQSFDGVQFGDATLVNDDIFALIPLLAAGYSAGDEIISKDLVFILSKQRADGSWEGSIDLSAAAVQALKPFDSINGVSASLEKASAFLAAQQESNGGFGSIYSSSWTMQAMKALNANWTKNSKTSADYLNSQQTTDGAALVASEIKTNRIWATSYAIPAALGKTWQEILKPVLKTLPVEDIVAPLEPLTPLMIAPLPQEISVVSVENKEISKAEKEQEITTPVFKVASLNKEETQAQETVEEPITEVQETPVEEPVKTERTMPTPIAIGVIVLIGAAVLVRFFI